MLWKLKKFRDFKLYRITRNYHRRCFENIYFESSCEHLTELSLFNRGYAICWRTVQDEIMSDQGISIKSTKGFFHNKNISPQCQQLR